MKKLIFALMFLVSISCISITHAQTITAATTPNIVFARATQHTYIPFGQINPVTVNVLDINGFNLFKVVPNTIPPATTVPNIKLGKVSLVVLRTAIIARTVGSALPNHQVIAQVPDGTIAGSYEIDFHNGETIPISIIEDITIGAVGPRGPKGDKGDKGDTGLAGASGSSNLKKWVYFNGRTLVKNAQSGIGTIVRSGHQYTINFSPAFPDANYVVTDATSNGHCYIRRQADVCLVIYCLNSSGQGTQADFINLAFFR